METSTEGMEDMEAVEAFVEAFMEVSSSRASKKDSTQASMEVSSTRASMET